MLTALLMPATLVTGFFGMNTGGFPWGERRQRDAIRRAVIGGDGGGVYVAPCAGVFPAVGDIRGETFGIERQVENPTVFRDW